MVSPAACPGPCCTRCRTRPGGRTGPRHGGRPGPPRHSPSARQRHQVGPSDQDLCILTLYLAESPVILNLK